MGRLEVKRRTLALVQLVRDFDDDDDDDDDDDFNLSSNVDLQSTRERKNGQKGQNESDWKGIMTRGRSMETCKLVKFKLFAQSVQTNLALPQAAQLSIFLK